MIEFVSAMALIAMTCLGYFSNIFDFNELFNVSFETLLLFNIFGRCFMTISFRQTIEGKKRIIYESIIFIISTICLSILYLYHANYLLVNSTLLMAFIMIVCFLIFLSVKIYIIKYNIYGKRYLFWQILDIILLGCCTFLSLYINNYNLNFKLGILAISFMTILGIINEHITRKLDYWVALNGFKTEIELLVLNREINRITYPPEKNLKEDKIFSKCVTILDLSTIRVIETHSLVKIVSKILLKYGYSFKEAHRVSSGFLMVLNNNLMRRNLDGSIIPSRILNLYYNFKNKK
jgi:hypothetical protein